MYSKKWSQNRGDYRMILNSMSLSHLFFNNRKINKAENELAARMNEEQSYLFLESLAQSIKCKCGERFYSQEGLRGHVCRN